jgi:hypothetical protein
MKGKKVSWAEFNHEIDTNQRSKWLSWMEKCIERKVNLLGKTIAQVKIELGVEHVMKEEKKVKRNHSIVLGICEMLTLLLIKTKLK